MANRTRSLRNTCKYFCANSTKWDRKWRPYSYTLFWGGIRLASLVTEDKPLRKLHTLPMTSTLLAISRAVDGVRGRSNVPPHRIHRRASVGRSILALRRVPAELDRLQYCAGARPTIAINLSQPEHVAAPISNDRRKRDDEYDGEERLIFL